jgi:hypothetical protein
MWSGKIKINFLKSDFNHHINVNNILTLINPSGFTPGDSAVNQLLYITNEFGRALDEGKGTTI